MKIGVFDSGLGGLTILRSVRARLPQYDYEYFGDTAHLPYGNKSEDEIRTLTRNGIAHLVKKGATLVVVACNTASAESVRSLQAEFEAQGVKVLGVVIPTIESVIDHGLVSPFLVATTRTVISEKYDAEFAERTENSVHLVSEATPELVPLIEAGKFVEALSFLKERVMLRVGEIDSVILGCTHYTFLKEGLRSAFPWLEIISQDEVIPGKLLTYLRNHPEIESTLTRTGTVQIELSSVMPQYAPFTRELMTTARE